ncbi:MAG: SusC/RagA family TonB-linked outer membrane protein [Gemmatimonadales bacterium]|nr:MAG: SusC/RagA family TonB-linked outer membrane protein [Gemmatimonadales bacterium]
MRPLMDAQVYLVGGSRGTLSNAQGRYLLTNVPVGSWTVRVELLGYATQEQEVTLAAGQNLTLDFSLSQDAIALAELVVTGVGKETERRKLPTSVDVISADEISQVPVTSVDQLLQGRVAGATVNAQSAQAGTAALINFRGVSSVFGAQTPVIYVDGVRVDNSQSTAAGTGGEQSSALADLLTSDIERIEVTKGGAASTLYGSDAATGVIQIFTKKGRPGDTRVTYRSEFGWDVPELKYMFDTPVAFPSLVEDGSTSPTFMEDKFWQTGAALNQYVGVSGGNDAITFNVSGRIQNEEGVQPKNESTIYAVRGGVQAQIRDDFTLNFSGNYTRSQFERLFNGTAIADPLTTFEVGDALFFSGAADLDEALDIFLSPDIDEAVDRFIFSGGFSWDVTDNIFARLTTGLDYRGNSQRILEPIGFTPGEPTGQLTRYDRRFTSFSLDAAVGYSWVSEDGSFANDLTLGVQGFRDDETRFSSTGTTFALPGAPDFDEAADISSFESNTEVFSGGVYLDESFDLWERLTLSAGVRFDGSTAFGDEVSTEVYPKAGVSYLLSEEEFFNLGLVDQFKLRAAYGETGKPPSPFDKDRSFSAISFRGESAPRFDNPGNPDLKPERTATYEVGFDASFFNSRLGLDVTWYTATTTDALFFVPEPPSSGQGTQLRNVGEIQNTGWEIGWNAQILNRERLAWALGGTFQIVDNEVTDMGLAAPFYVESQKRVEEGHPVGAWHVTTPVDTNGDGLPDGSERQFTGGQPTPDRSGSLNTTFRIGNNLTLSSLADFAMGHEVMDFGSVWATFNGIYRREEVEGVPFPIRYDAAGNEIGTYSQSAARSGFIYDGDWFKWREVSVRYTLPESLPARVGAARGSVYASGRNLWIWSRNDMIDPELNGLSGAGLALGGESSITASAPKRWRFGVELVF